mmetsp:Transcript_29638/g.78089  ORF Transcript_29638/g.78089 Transcript_29638/m.78089 type:complete len:288 (-) Transcript_29638:296-1159(-)
MLDKAGAEPQKFGALDLVLAVDELGTQQLQVRLALHRRHVADELQGALGHHTPPPSSRCGLCLPFGAGLCILDRRLLLGRLRVPLLPRLLHRRSRSLLIGPPGLLLPDGVDEENKHAGDEEAHDAEDEVVQRLQLLGEHLGGAREGDGEVLEDAEVDGEEGDGADEAQGGELGQEALHHREQVGGHRPLEQLTARLEDHRRRRDERDEDDGPCADRLVLGRRGALLFFEALAQLGVHGDQPAGLLLLQRRASCCMSRFFGQDITVDNEQLLMLLGLGCGRKNQCLLV